MSLVSIRKALETALNGITPAIATAWENMPFTPPAITVPYQRVFLLMAEPENPTFGDGFHREQGILQVSLLYPTSNAPGAVVATTRAELIRSTFTRGASFSSGGITVTIAATPEIGSGVIDGDRFFLPVKIRFYSNI